VPNNQLLGVGYDLAGNELSFGGDTVVYDEENRVSALKTSSGSVLASYVYDADGKRISKTAGSVTTNYVYDGFGQLMAEYTGRPAELCRRNMSGCAARLLRRGRIWWRLKMHRVMVHRVRRAS